MGLNTNKYENPVPPCKNKTQNYLNPMSKTIKPCGSICSYNGQKILKKEQDIKEKKMDTTEVRLLMSLFFPPLFLTVLLTLVDKILKKNFHLLVLLFPSYLNK